MILHPNILLMRGNQFNPTKELSQILFQSSSLRKQEQEPKKE